MLLKLAMLLDFNKIGMEHIDFIRKTCPVIIWA